MSKNISRQWAAILVGTLILVITLHKLLIKPCNGFELFVTWPAWFIGAFIVFCAAQRASLESAGLLMRIWASLNALALSLTAVLMPAVTDAVFFCFVDLPFEHINAVTFSIWTFIATICSSGLLFWRMRKLIG